MRSEALNKASNKASFDKNLAAIRIQQKDATLWVGRLKPGKTVKVPEASHVHLFVAKGSGTLEHAGALDQGDAARLTRAGSSASVVTATALVRAPFSVAFTEDAQKKSFDASMLPVFWIVICATPPKTPGATFVRARAALQEAFELLIDVALRDERLRR